MFEVEVEEIGPALKYATAKVTRSSGGGGVVLRRLVAAAPTTGATRPANPIRATPVSGSGGADPWASAQSEEPPF